MNAHDRVATDPHAGQHGHLSADPDVVLDDDGARLAGLATISRRLGVGEMVPDLTGTEDAIGADVDSVSGDDGAAVQPGVPADVDDRLRARGDQAVDLGVRPGVDVRLQHHPPGALDAQPAIPE